MSQSGTICGTISAAAIQPAAAIAKPQKLTTKGS
jgi:hypothetical protein